MALFAGVLSAQNSFIYPFIIGKTGTATGQITLRGITSGSAVIRVNAVAGTGIILELPVTNGTNGQVLTTNGNGVLSWNVGGATDTTHLSDRIDLKVNIADTASMLAPYLQIVDTTAMLTDYINKADTASMLTNYIARADTASMLISYVNHNDTTSMLTPYINRADTASMLTDYINKADTASMLTDYINKADTTGMLTNYILESEVTAEQLLDQKLATVRTMMTFGKGGGDAGDTTAFTTTGIYGSVYWGGPLSFHVDTMIVSIVHGAGLDTLDLQISWDDNLLDATPTNLNTVALPIGRYGGTNLALTSGQIDATFDNAVIPPGKIVYCTTPYVPAAALKRKPTYLSVSLIGHLQ